MGWGNRPDHRTVWWLIDQVVDAGWHVHAATLPVHVTDVKREWVAPVEEFALLARITFDLKFLPSGIENRKLLGEHATDRQLRDDPDRIVSTRAIGDRVESARIVLYDGGHELFSSASRDGHVGTVIDALSDGPEALD